VQEGEQVVGILPGGVEADQQSDGAVSLDNRFEPLAELLVAGRGLGEGEFGSSGLQVVAEEAGVVAVA
jgi:hypothetical protein